MRILHFYKTYFPDSHSGVAQVIRQLALGCVDRGIDVDVLTVSRNPAQNPIEVDGYRIHQAAMNFEFASAAMSLGAIGKFRRLAREADVIHYHFPWPLADIAHFVVRSDRPTLVTYHSDIVRQKFTLNLYRPLKNWFLRNVDRVVATSPPYSETSNALRRFAAKADIVPIGIDRASYPEPDAVTVDRWRSIVGDDFFLFVGALRYYKGLHILLDAAKNANVAVVIAGSGPCEEALHAQTRRLDLTNVRFTGEISEGDKVALLKLCRAFVFPSHLRSEAFGVSLVEAAMYGRPMISTEIGTGTSFVNCDGITGLIVPPNDAKALASAMQTLHGDAERAANMGRSALARYEEHFTAARMVDRYVALYHDLVEARRKAPNRA